VVPEQNEAHRSRAIVLLPKGSATKDDTVLTTVAHDGLEYDICKRVQPLGNRWFNGASYIDLMSPDAVKALFESTHEKYKEACGHHFGKTIPGIFTDEPCYLFQIDYQVPVVPWSEFLPGFFEEAKGYDIRSKLPMLFFDIDDYRKVRLDFYDAATALFKKSFTEQYYRWCEANNLIMTGHFMSEDSLRFQTQWSGDVMAHYEFMHWPGIDKLARTINPGWCGYDQTVTVKQLTTVSDQLGKERAFSEVYGGMGGQCSFFHRKWIGDWQAALGINFVNHHLSLYSMRGERKRDYPANLFYQQPWWDDEKDFADYQGRLCAAITGGKRIVDILLIQPLTSVWSEYSPLHASTGFAPENAYDGPFAGISRRMMEEKLDHHYGNENLMAKYGAVEGSKLRVGEYAYDCVIVPPTSNLKSSTLSLLSEYAKAGGKLIVVGKMPEYVDGAPADVQISNAVLVPSIHDAVGMANTLFADRVRVTDRQTGRNAPAAYVHSRDFGGSVRHLIVNTDDKRGIRARISIPACGDTAVFDLFDGNVYRLDTDGDGFDVYLAPAGSLLIICGDEARDAADAVPAALGSGANFTDFVGSIPTVVMDEFDCELLDENVLLLNDFALELNGTKVYEGPACGAWHGHFYAAPEGTPFKVTYTFHSDSKVEGCTAVIEVAENLDEISFNGSSVHPLKSRGELGPMDSKKSWRDINFTRVPLSTVRKGANTLVIEGKKANNITGPGWHIRIPDWETHQATEAEEVYILGRFNVRPLTDGIYGIAGYRQPSGKDLTYEGFPFYCGRTILKGAFDLPENPDGTVFLQLNGARIASAQIRVNGVQCGSLRWPPFVIDVSAAVRTGANSVEIEMATTLVNAFGPNRCARIKDATDIHTGYFVTMEQHKPEYELFSFGIDNVGVHIVPK
jgi:hypothetical protein